MPPRIRAGVSLPALMTLLGHVKAEMTMKYVQVAGNDLQRESHLARSQPRHLAPQPKAPGISPRAGLEGVVDPLLFAQHFTEMFRRSLPDGSPRHRFDQLANRPTKILSETRNHRGPFGRPEYRAPATCSSWRIARGESELRRGCTSDRSAPETRTARAGQTRPRGRRRPGSTAGRPGSRSQRMRKPLPPALRPGAGFRSNSAASAWAARRRRGPLGWPDPPSALAACAMSDCSDAPAARAGFGSSPDVP